MWVAAKRAKASIHFEANVRSWLEGPKGVLDLMHMAEAELFKQRMEVLKSSTQVESLELHDTL